MWYSGHRVNVYGLPPKPDCQEKQENVVIGGTAKVQEDRGCRAVQMIQNRDPTANYRYSKTKLQSQILSKASGGAHNLLAGSQMRHTEVNFYTISLSLAVWLDTSTGFDLCHHILLSLASIMLSSLFTLLELQALLELIRREENGHSGTLIDSADKIEREIRRPELETGIWDNRQHVSYPTLEKSPGPYQERDMLSFPLGQKRCHSPSADGRLVRQKSESAPSLATELTHSTLPDNKKHLKGCLTLAIGVFLEVKFKQAVLEMKILSEDGNKKILLKDWIFWPVEEIFFSSAVLKESLPPPTVAEVQKLGPNGIHFFSQLGVYFQKLLLVVLLGYSHPILDFFKDLLVNICVNYVLNYGLLFPQPEIICQNSSKTKAQVLNIIKLDDRIGPKTIAKYVEDGLKFCLLAGGVRHLSYAFKWLVHDIYYSEKIRNSGLACLVVVVVLKLLAIAAARSSLGLPSYPGQDILQLWLLSHGGGLGKYRW
ncbi:hypothetical protein CPC08DRAFT_803274 [Agrocybe pediades]|nr:hypothetical protein CPC08DRAFT_803274 [Agrocybe pediades]